MQYREDRFTVKTYDCGPDGQIKLNALMQYMQEAAARHAEQLGFGFRDLNEHDCFWVLVNLRIELTRTPKWGQDITIRTWPSGSTRVVASREFIGKDPEGELFRAASEWMILDKHSSRPRSLSRLNLGLPPTGPGALSSKLQRLEPVDGYKRTCVLHVPFSSLDLNGHVNNTEYTRWALDGLHEGLGGLPQIRTLQVAYLAEVFEGDDVEVLVSTDSETHIHALVRRCDTTTGTNAFLMEAWC